MTEQTRFSFATLPVGRWRNGGGTTREIASWPAAINDGEAPAFGWRASIATIAADGDFSVFSGVDRSITLLEGTGVVLHGAEGRSHPLRHPGQPYAFTGEEPIRAALLAGPSLDFNIMTRRRDYRAAVRRITQVQSLPAGRDGVIYILSGQWQLAGEAPLAARDGVWWHHRREAALLQPAGPDAVALWADITHCPPAGGA